MATNMKDPKLQELLERLGDLTGEPADEALRRLISERVRQLEAARGNDPVGEGAEEQAMRLVEIGRRCVEAVGRGNAVSKSDLYDEMGLPR